MFWLHPEANYCDNGEQVEQIERNCQETAGGSGKKQLRFP